MHCIAKIVITFIYQSLMGATILLNWDIFLCWKKIYIQKVSCRDGDYCCCIYLAREANGCSRCQPFEVGNVLFKTFLILTNSYKDFKIGTFNVRGSRERRLFSGKTSNSHHSYMEQWHHKEQSVKFTPFYSEELRRPTSISRVCGADRKRQLRVICKVAEDGKLFSWWWVEIKTVISDGASS